LHQFDNTRKIMADDSSEIAKLTERISKDPKSKLFVPLAEEYKKMGDIEMAIHVLSEGLKVNPSYVTARSFLGRLLLEQGDFAASQKEFEEVVKAIPDNLLAQKKLGDLHLLQSRQKEALVMRRLLRSFQSWNQGLTQVLSSFSRTPGSRPTKLFCLLLNQYNRQLVHYRPSPRRLPLLMAPWTKSRRRRPCRSTCWMPYLDKWNMNR
jgi:tetratricopeptide (TPR) repeat protein